ncbi:LuxR C-terminal-related transcriptional regulator [Leucobacter sp. GX24907]
MNNVIDANIADLPQVLLDGIGDSRPVLLLGPSGSGKTFVLRALAACLEERGIPHLRIDASSSESIRAVESAPDRAVLLFDDYERAPEDVLRAIAAHLRSGAAGVGAVTEDLFAADYGSPLGGMYDRFPAMEETLRVARFVRIQPADDEQIARILHSSTSERLDAVTVSTIQHLAWGRPGWALDILHLYSNGSITSTPLPGIRRPYAGNLQLSSLRNPARVAAAELSAADVAAAIALSELGPRSKNGVLDIVGSSSYRRLLSCGLLITAPTSTESYGVPELYAAAIQGSTDPELVTSARRRAATHLLAQEVFGIPLADREAIFCSRVLTRHGDEEDEVDTDPSLGEHHARFQKRFVCDLISFGEGERARDLLLQLGRHGPGLSNLVRTRLTAVLHDAHTGLQSLMVRNPPQGNCDLPSTDPSTRFATLLLQSRLAAQAGILIEDDPDTSPDDEQWNDAQLVARRWNDDRPLGSDAPALLRIARTHVFPEVAMLAEQLLSLDATVLGLRYRSFVGSPIDQQVSRLAIGASDAQRDALECVVMARSIIRFFSSDHGGNETRSINLVDCLPGASRHRLWATHLHAARVAVLCGDLDRAQFEWEQFSNRIPRFIPWRLHSLIARLKQMASEQSTALESLGGYSSHLLAYFAGRLDEVNPAVFADPVAELARLGALPPGVDPSEFEGLPERTSIRMHLEALKQQNPLALMRAAAALEASGFWAPAAYAMQEARRIFLRRRASGSVTAADARIAALQAETARRVAWFDPESLTSTPRERLTPRENETAQLAAEGLSNREIAERMNCSVRTVESHLSQARAKLGVTNREDLGARLHRLAARTFPPIDQSPRCPETTTNDRSPVALPDRRRSRRP